MCITMKMTLSLLPLAITSVSASLSGLGESVKSRLGQLEIMASFHRLVIAPFPVFNAHSAVSVDVWVNSLYKQRNSWSQIYEYDHC